MARSSYYLAKRQESEHVCDFLLHLNGYARAAQIQYEKGGAESEDHVEHFLLYCGDDDLMDFIYPQRLGDIHLVEQIIRHRLLVEKRKMQRDRMSNSRLIDDHRYESRVNVRRDSRNDSTRRLKSRRDERIDDHKFNHRKRRDDLRFDHRERRDEHRLVNRDRQPRRGVRTERYKRDNSRSITLASTNTDDLRAAIDELRFRQHTDQYKSPDEESEYDHPNDYESDPDTDYMKVCREVNMVTLSTERGEPLRSGPNNICRAGVPAYHSERTGQRYQVNQRHDKTTQENATHGVPAVRVVQQATTLIFADVGASSANKCMTPAGVNFSLSLKD